MHHLKTVYINVIYILLLIVGVQSQRGGGGGGSSGGGGGFSGGGGYYFGSGGTGSCSIICKIVLGSIFGAIGVILIGILSFCYIRKCCRGRTFYSTSQWVNRRELFSQDLGEKPEIFHSGSWSGEYFQDGYYHKLPECTIKFDYERSTLTGHGTDDVGDYTLTGVYSTRTLKMGIVKTYILGTGPNRQHNLGHNVNIHLEWNENEKDFQGKWYVRTSQYQGENKYKLRCLDPSPPMYHTLKLDNM
ncbi:unnamed protein product [Didymodactylos carnosus]|uniref:Uncharacterized protein n=1 Tax=Didymodactylos carnosus TaxID=1234261 RepID=A0A815XVP4_9BILA|nr:unnamed protein product [Didymodactylos carnosus]CAF4423731.1 unnamed protein product [Didymodactylos carnosus]